MKRYEHLCASDCEIYESKDGEWVRYEDVKELIVLDKKLKELYGDTTIEFSFRDKLVGIVSEYIGEGN